MSKLIMVYKALRKSPRNFTAVEALERARGFASGDKWPQVYGRPIVYNPSFDGGKRFLEHAENGLRFRGFSDEVNSHIRHNGWFTTVDGWSGETVRGCVYQLPTRNRETLFLAGYIESDSEGTVVDFGQLYDEEIAAAYAADSMAEYAAEIEREIDEGFTLGSEWESAREEAKSAREEALSLIRELKTEKAEYSPAICSAIRSQLTGLIGQWRQAKWEMAQAIEKAEISDNVLSGFNDRTGLNIKG